jgi:hypothetical protein
VLLANTAEGGTNGNTVTAGTSGGASGNAFDTVTGAPLFSSTQAAHGTLAYGFTTTTAATLSLNWTTSVGSVAVVAGRADLYASSFSVGSMICRARDGTAAQIFRIITDTTGKISLRVGAANTLVGTGANSMSVNTWYRIEWVINVAASAQVDVRVYPGDSTTLFDSVTSSTANTGTSNAVEVNVGVFTSTASVPQYYLDDIVISDGTFPGPAVVAVTDTTGTVRPLAAVDSVTGAAAVSDAAGVARLTSSPDATTGAASLTDSAPAVRLVGASDTASAAVQVADSAGIVRLLRTLDSGTGAATVLGWRRPATRSAQPGHRRGRWWRGGFSGSDSAGVLRLLGPEDCWRAATDVSRPDTGSVTRPATGLVPRPDSGLVCRP